MILKWQKLLKLFSTTPDLKLSEHTRLHIYFRESHWARRLFWIPRAIIAVLLLLLLPSLPVWLGLICVFITVTLLVFDILRARAVCLISSLGFDGRWFLIEGAQNRVDVELVGEVVVNGHFVALEFIERSHDRVTRSGRNRRWPVVCGAWNLSVKDFHALRVCLMSS